MLDDAILGARIPRRSAGMVKLSRRLFSKWGLFRRSFQCTHRITPSKDTQIQTPDVWSREMSSPTRQTVFLALAEFQGFGLSDLTDQAKRFTLHSCIAGLHTWIHFEITTSWDGLMFTIGKTHALGDRQASRCAGDILMILVIIPRQSAVDMVREYHIRNIKWQCSMCMGRSCQTRPCRVAS